MINLYLWLQMGLLIQNDVTGNLDMEILKNFQTILQFFIFLIQKILIIMDTNILIYIHILHITMEVKNIEMGAL